MSLKKIVESMKHDDIEKILRDLYIKKDYNMVQISEELMVSLGTVHKWLKEYNISKEKNLFS